YQRLIKLLWNEQRFDEAFTYAEQARAQTFLDPRGNPWLEYESPDFSPLVREEQSLRRRIAGLKRAERRAQDKPTDQTNQALVDRLHNQLQETNRSYDQIVTQLKQVEPEYASFISTDSTTIQQVQQDLLDGDTTLVKYFILNKEAVAWVIDKDQAALVALDISYNELVDQVGKMRAEIESRDEDLSQAAALYDSLFRPLTGHIKHANIIIMPHSVLTYLPFAALWDAENQRYLVEDYAVSYAPSASVLRFAQQKRNPDQNRIVAVGDPDGEQIAADLEVQAAANAFGATAKVAQDATETLVVEQAPNADFLHLAAPGIYKPFGSLFSSIDLRADDQNDGKLEVHEIFGLNLADANLVTVSDSAAELNVESNGEEIVEMNRAFHFAGAPAVVSTLWQVDDDATAELIGTFYASLRDGMTTAEALRAGQLKLLKESAKSDPFYWSAFSLFGDYLGEGQVQMSAPPAAALGTTNAITSENEAAAAAAAETSATETTSSTTIMDVSEVASGPGRIDTSIASNSATTGEENAEAANAEAPAENSDLSGPALFEAANTFCNGFTIPVGLVLLAGIWQRFGRKREDEE
ncbi:MAG: CHAT domain-containing protein, partial [Caldilineaceae bacterium]|nr:CHAT domain-containing protein [Caldilineaceae bacterium]